MPEKSFEKNFNSSNNPQSEREISEEFSEFQQENFEEHENWRKNLKEVVNAMKTKRDALKEVVSAMQQKQAGKQDIRTLVIVLGGGMQGAYAAGQLRALQVMGYTTKNVTGDDSFLGISVGAPMCAFALAGLEQGLMGVTYFYTVCAGKEFINFLRLNKVVDVSVLEKALRSGPQKIDVDAVRSQPIQFYVQAYNQTTKEPEFINAKDKDIDTITAIHASVAIPVVYDKAIVLNDSKYTDGAFDDPLPIIRAIEKFNPTHVLILPNIPFSQVPTGEASKMEKIAVSVLPSRGNLGFLRKILINRQSLRQSMDVIATSHNVKIGVAWPPDMGLNLFSQNVSQIKTAIKTSGKEMFKLYGEQENELVLYEEQHGKLPA